MLRSCETPSTKSISAQRFFVSGEMLMRAKYESAYKCNAHHKNGNRRRERKKNRTTTTFVGKPIEAAFGWRSFSSTVCIKGCCSHRKTISLLTTLLDFTLVFHRFYFLFRFELEPTDWNISKSQIHFSNVFGVSVLKNVCSSFYFETKSKKF